MYTRPDQPQSVGGILDSGFGILKSGFGKIWLLAFAAAIVNGVWTLALAAVVLGQTDLTVFFPDLAGNVPLIAGACVVYAAISSILSASIIAMVAAVASGEDASIGTAFATGIGRAPAFFAISLMYAFAVAIGTVLLLVPGIYLSISLAFGFFAVVVDRRGPLEGIRSSHGLVKGNWWHVAGVLTIVSIIAFVFYSSADFVAAMFSFVVPGETSLQNLLLDLLLTQFIASFAIAILACVGMATYQDLKLRSEGTDLAQRIEALDRM